MATNNIYLVRGIADLNLERAAIGIKIGTVKALEEIDGR
jgi:hypothetical protein